jgi:UDP-glucose:glycoprotein glucosyltransferase
MDRIADGYFSKASTDKELYEQFIKVLKDDGHISDLETLASYQFALSIRSSAPRIEAHYQYYHTSTEPYLAPEQDASCPIWVLLNGKQYCSPILEEAYGDVGGDSYAFSLQIGDRKANTQVKASERATI